MEKFQSNFTGTTSSSFQIGKHGLTIHQGESEPQNSFGNNGDIFLKYSGEIYRKISDKWQESTQTGTVFITDIVPQSEGNVGNKTFSSDGRVLENCTTDTQNVNVSVIALPGISNWKPIISIEGNSITMSAESDEPVFTGSIDIDLAGASELTVIHEDGAKHKVDIIQDTQPEVLEAYFTNGYPGSQTELKENDTFDFYVKSDIPIVSVEFDGSSSYAFKAITVSLSEGDEHIITGNQIANRGNNVQDLPTRVRVQKSTGSWSEWFVTDSAGSDDGIHTVKVNNRHPSISITSIEYPSGQQAIKGSEYATVNNTVNYFDDITYSSPNGELSIDDPNLFQSSKSVMRIDGGYNVTSNNFHITATRNANDAISSDNTVVYIADSDQTISVSSPSRLRSGGNDNTSPQNHTITISSDQNLIEAPSLAAPVGDWQGSGFTGSGTTWTRDLQIHDDMVKGTYNWSSISTKNLAGKTVSVISSGQDYTIGGFVSRNISLDAFAYETYMSVEATIYDKVILSWSFNPDVTIRESLDSMPVISESWCLDALNTNPTAIRILDSAYESSSQTSTITIQEGM